MPNGGLVRAARQISENPRSARQPAASLHERIGELLGLKTILHSEVDLIERLEKGLPVSVVQALRARLGLTDDEVYQLIAPRRTLNRREAEHQPLSREEVDRTVRVARTWALAQQVFSAKPEYAREWLRATQRLLGGRAPLQALASESGARAVEEVLIGIEHGQFA
jgi:putative toxin-antitoxin system antitoxin component (TIGR02293 family)